MNTNKKFFSKIGFNYLILAVVAIIAQIILVTITTGINADILSDINTLTVLSAVCNYILPLPIFIYLMKKLESENPTKQSIGIFTFIKYAAITFTLMWAGNIFGLILTSLIGGITSTDIANPVQNLINSSDIWLNLLLISIIGPIFEELLFRKFLVDRTLKYGARVSIILSAIIFGFFHGNLNQFFYAFLMGGFFAYVYIKTGNITYPILLHICVNLMGSVISLFVVENAQAIIGGAITPMSVAVVLIYVLIILGSMIIGLYYLFNYKKYKFNGLKTRIPLKNPLKTVILNYGMVCFIAFCIFEIIYQIVS